MDSDFPSIQLPNCNIWNFISPSAQWEHFTALICGQTFKSYTYKELFASALRWAKEMKNNFQDQKPPIVAFILPNSIEYIALFQGCAAVGAPICPIRHDYDPDFILYLLKETNSSVIIVDSCVLDTCRKITDKMDREMKTYVVGVDTTLRKNEKNCLQILYSDSEMLDLEEAKQVDPDTIGIITFSSGTTGAPKGVLHSQKSLVDNVAAYTQDCVFPIKTTKEPFQDTILLTLPLAHTYGVQYIGIAAISKGCRTIISDPFEFSNILAVMDKYKPRMLKINPYVIETLSNMSEFGTSFDSVEIITNVGSHHNPETFERLRQKTGKNLLLSEVYGASEMLVVISTPQDHMGLLGPTGKIIPNMKYCFVDMATQERIQEPHKVGELWTLTPWVMRGYLNNPDATRDAIVKGGWFRTGDIGYYDDNHFIYIIERAKDIITVNGQKICPSNIETLLMSHPSVEDVGVIGVLNTKTKAEEPRAFVVRKELAAVQESELVKFVQENAKPEMWLTGGVVFVDSLPRNHLGKLVRKHLRTMAWLTRE